ncbi:hypothetical protein GGS21DRAFT_112505 [Xylaria nigripes]|nr:hypothetical protein GGS21DRAFT_112505 [Xylaria nigripes]
MPCDAKTRGEKEKERARQALKQCSGLDGGFRENVRRWLCYVIIFFPFLVVCFVSCLWGGGERACLVHPYHTYPACLSHGCAGQYIGYIHTYCHAWYFTDVWDVEDYRDRNSTRPVRHSKLGPVAVALLRIYTHISVSRTEKQKNKKK